MITLADSAAADKILSEVRREARSSETVQAACQRVMEGLVARLSSSLLLARAYLTVPWQNLPEADRLFARTVAANAASAHLLRNDTRVLSLLGTAGLEPSWRDRYSSSGHLAIPLLSPEFVAGIPMVAGLIDQLGSSVRWYGQISQGATKDTFGVFTGSFFVPDASSTRDSAGRLLIPAQDFVKRYGIRSVFGVGGQFQASGMILVCIFFSNVELDETPGWLLRLPLIIAGITQPLLASGRTFAAG